MTYRSDNGEEDYKQKLFNLAIGTLGRLRQKPVMWLEEVSRNENKYILLYYIEGQLHN